MRRRGFTLFEVLVALGLIGMLTGSMFAFLWSLLGRRDVLHRRSLEQQGAGAFIERLEADVMCGLAGDDAAGAGVSGTAASLKVLTRGVWLPMGQADRGAGDTQSSEYSYDAGTGVLRGRRWSGGSAPEFETISEQIEQVRMRYFDGEKWRESFDSLAEGSLPVAIEVALWFGEPRTAGQVVRDQRVAKTGATGRSADPLESSDSGRPRVPSRQPDRLRVIVVPDGPVSSWKEAR